MSGPEATDRRDPFESLPFIAGRSREVEHLHGWIEQARDGFGGLVLLSGEAGIGKTTLCAAVTRDAAEAGMLTLSGGCYDLTTTPPYGPWTEALRTYPEFPEMPAVPEQLEAGSGMLGIDSQAALFELVGQFLSAVAVAWPTLIVLEDLHWADHASLDLLRYLSRTLSGLPILIVVTYRDGDLDQSDHLSSLLPVLIREGNVQRLPLQQLDRAAVLALVQREYRLSIDDELRLTEYLQRLAEGNPFFISELLFALAEQQLLAPVTGGWWLGDLKRAAIPPLVQQVIHRRLARLDHEARQLLELAAVIGYDAPLDLMPRLHDRSTRGLDASLQQLLDVRLLEVGLGQTTVRFRHAIVRQVVYQSTSLLRRQTLHREVAEALSTNQRPDAVIVANHFHAAGDERALVWSVTAVEESQRLFAVEAVIDECQRAIDLADRLRTDPPLALYRLRGHARDALGDFDGACLDFEFVLTEARERDDLRAEWQALVDLAVLWSARDYEQTQRYCQQAVELARTMDDQRPLGDSLNRLGNWYANAEDPANSIPLHHEALSIFEEMRDSRGMGNSLELLGMAYALLGDIPNSGRHMAQAIPILQRHDDLQALHSALINASIGSWGGWPWRVARFESNPVPRARVVAQQQEGLEIARDMNWRSGIAYGAGSTGLCHAGFGDLRRGLNYLREGLAEAESIGHQMWIAQINSLTGLLLLEILLPDHARPHLEIAVEVARAVGSSFFGTGSIGLLASALIQLGRLDEADVLLSPHIDRSAPLSMVSARLCWYACAELLLARERGSEALQTVDHLIASIPAGPGPVSPYLTWLRGEILVACGESTHAERQLKRSLGDAVLLGLPLIHWRILAAQCRLFWAQGRDAEAKTVGRDALMIVDQLADQLDDEEMREALLTNARKQIPAGASLRSAQVSLTDNAGLTRRELEVLRVVAEGLTDAEAGERLYIATRTVSQHLRSVYNKLGVNNRTAAVRVAFEQGIL